MTATVHLPAYLRQYAQGDSAVGVEGSTVAECLAALVQRYPDMTSMLFDGKGRLHDYVSIYLGEDFVFGTDLSHPVEDGQQMHILYILGGG